MKHTMGGFAGQLPALHDDAQKTLYKLRPQLAQTKKKEKRDLKTAIFDEMAKTRDQLQDKMQLSLVFN